MNEQEYVENRLEDQITWYDTKSIQNQKIYKRLRFLEIILASSIPVLSMTFEAFDFPDKYHTVVFGCVGVVISVLASTLALGKYQELWQSYRTTCENLKKEKFLYFAGSRPYNIEKRYTLLVERIESLISKENTNWSELITAGEEGDKK